MQRTHSLCNIPAQVARTTGTVLATEVLYVSEVGK